MAKGDTVLFEEFPYNLAQATMNLSTDSFALILINSLPSADQATPGSADFTEVAAGGNYSTGGIALTTTFVEAAGIATFDSSVNPSWALGAGGPTDIVAALLINTTMAGAQGDAVGFVDLTNDAGVTPVSLVDGPVSVNWHANGIYRILRA